MSKKFFHLFYLGIFLIGGCFSSSPQKPQKKPSVIVTLSPYHVLVKEIAADTIEVSCLIDKGKNPHSFEPSFKDSQKIYDSSIWFYLNEPFEEKILFSIGTKLHAVDLCQSIPLLSSSCHDHSHDHSLDHNHQHLMDRHLWLSPKRVKRQCETIANALILQFPKHADLYKKNLQTILAKLSTLDKEIEEIFSKAEKNTLFVSHPAFTYLCKDYNLQQLFVEQEDKELNWQELEALIALTKKQKVTTLFHQKQYNLQIAKQLSSKLDLALVTIDPFAENYYENMLNMATLFAKSLTVHDTKRN